MAPSIHLSELRCLICRLGKASLPCVGMRHGHGHSVLRAVELLGRGWFFSLGFAPVLSAAEHVAEGQEPLWVTHLGNNRSLSTSWVPGIVQGSRRQQ